MKKNLQFIIFTIVCGLMFTGCGSGSGSKIKQNDYLGSLPAIYHEYEIARADSEAKMNKKAKELFANGGEQSKSKFDKMSEEYATAEKSIKDKLKADVKAEVENLVGKEIPVSYNDTLENSGKRYFDVKIKLIDDKGELGYTTSVVAKDDFSIPPMKRDDYTIYYRLIGDNGRVITNSTTCILVAPTSQKAVSFKKGELVSEQSRSFPFVIPAELAGFSKIEFVSKEQYLAKIGR